MAFWASVSHEIRRKRIPRNQKSKLKALIEEHKNTWILERSGKVTTSDQSPDLVPIETELVFEIGVGVGKGAHRRSPLFKGDQPNYTRL